MTDEELAEIRKRVAATSTASAHNPRPRHSTDGWAVIDRRNLLAECVRLRERERVLVAGLREAIEEIEAWWNDRPDGGLAQLDRLRGLL